MVDIKIEGLEEAMRRLRNLPKDLQAGSSSPIWFGLLKAGELVRDEAKMLAPVKTGKLRDSIRVRKRPKRINRIRNNDNPARQVVPLRMQHIAQWVEFGTGSFFAGSPDRIKPSKAKGKKILFNRAENEIYGASARGQAPQPFMRPAFERSWSRAIEAFGKGFAAKVKRLERKWRRGN